MSGGTESGSRSVRVFTHPSSLEHDPGTGHPESPARVRAIVASLRASSVRAEWTEVEPAHEEALLRVHPREYLDLLERVARNGGGAIDADTVMSSATWDAAIHAAGAAIGAARSALDGVPAFAAVRPPGHHATADRAMGFCFVNNVVVAARAMIDERNLERVLIVDWDVHHGNGTQALVERDPRIRYVSLHEWPLYPGTGRAEERGVGNIFTVPRPPGLDRARYVADLNAAVDAATDGWMPDLLLVSAGFDAMAGDPLAGFTLEPEDYATWLTSWRGIGAPMASVLEGGYAPTRIAAAAVAHVDAMSAAP
jgi:acetoin utilization deacetylase AcuC-like enzyme